MKLTLGYLTFLQIVTVGTSVYGLTAWFSWTGLVVSIALFVIFGGLGMAVTYHRRISHRAFPTNPFWEWVGTVSGYLGSHMSPVSWAVQHNAHHRYVDTELDPHSPAILGWRALFYIFHREPHSVPVMFAGRLMKMPDVVFVHRYGFWLIVAHVALCVPFGLSGLLYGFVLPVALTHVGLVISVFNHWPDGPGTFGALNALLTMGEHNHALHHNNPADVSRDGPSSWIISLIRTDK